MPAILFGSISTLADTSELQRQAFNEAFAAHGLAWNWDRATYRNLLANSGGQDRIAAYAADRGDKVDAAAVHLTKSELFQMSLSGTQLAPRPGVVDTIRQARGQGFKVALVTTTNPENVATMLSALAPTVQPGDLDLVVDASQVTASKPDQAAYVFALAHLGVQAGDALAIEDNLGGLASATAAGIRCIAFPNENTTGHDFDGAVANVDRIDFGRMQDFFVQ